MGVGARTDDRNHIVVASVQRTPACRRATGGVRRGCVEPTPGRRQNELRGPRLRGRRRRCPATAGSSACRPPGNLTDLWYVTLTRLQSRSSGSPPHPWRRQAGARRDTHIPDGTGSCSSTCGRTPAGCSRRPSRSPARSSMWSGSSRTRSAWSPTASSMPSAPARPPSLVLVDDGTASAARVVCGCRTATARTLGSRTFGKGSVQEPSTLSHGWPWRSRWGATTLSGKVIDGVGVEPDIAVRSSLGPIAAEGRRAAPLLVAASDTSSRRGWRGRRGRSALSQGEEGQMDDYF